jgi:hypothetical protein
MNEEEQAQNQSDMHKLRQQRATDMERSIVEDLLY